MKTNRIATLLALILSAFIATGCAVDTIDDENVGQSAEELRAPGKFVIFVGKDGQFYFHLKSGNGQIILDSEGYVARAGAENGIESVKTNAVDAANFQLKQAKDGQWYFNLRAGNYQVIGTSELYVSKYNAKRGAKTVRRVVTKLLRYEAAINGGAAFEIFEGKDGQLYFHLEAANHEIILQSEGYVSYAGALNGVESVRTNGKDLANFEIKQASNGQWYFNLRAANYQVIGTSELYVSKYNANRGAETVADLLYSERVADPQ